MVTELKFSRHNFWASGALTQCEINSEIDCGAPNPIM